MTTLDELPEGSTAIYTATLTDELGVVVADAALSAARLTVYSAESGGIVNGRNNQNCKNANGVTISNLGVIVWKLLEADTILIDTPPPEVGHLKAVFVFEWLDGGAVARQKVHELMIPIRHSRLAGFEATP